LVKVGLMKRFFKTWQTLVLVVLCQRPTLIGTSRLQIIQKSKPCDYVIITFGNLWQMMIHHQESSSKQIRSYSAPEMFPNIIRDHWKGS